MNKDMATYLDMTDLNNEMPCFELEDINEVENKLFMTDSEEDINNLAEASVDNADEGGINEDIPTNQQHSY